MRLTVEEDRETIKRYRHIRPARGLGVQHCGARCPGTVRTCTLREGHRGPHVAHGTLGKVVAVWDTGMEVRRAGGPGRVTTGSRVRDTVEASKPTGGLQHLWARLVRLNLSVEELALLVLFLALVGFVIHWMSMIVG